MAKWWQNNLRWRCCWYCGPPDLNTVGLMLRIVCSKCGNSLMLVTTDCCSTYWPFSSLKSNWNHWRYLMLVLVLLMPKIALTYDQNWFVRVLELIAWSTHHLSCIINFLPLHRHADEIIVIYLVVYPLMNQILESRSTLK